MATSDQLRANVKQHKPKNKESKKSDTRIYTAMGQCRLYLEDRFGEELRQQGYKLSLKKKISFGELIDIIDHANIRKEFDKTFNKSPVEPNKRREIKPDGGLILLTKANKAKIILVSEIKKQGTNKDRLEEGKPKQAQGNAIERLGKNLIGIRAALNHEPITPFVCFGWGCDFEENYTYDSFVMSKVLMMNEFYPLNRIYVFKQDGCRDKNRFSPVSMYFREKEWEIEEMLKVLKEVGETALRYYLY